MNDDFLKKHRIRPNSDLVDSITDRLETQQTRRTDMFANKLRPTLLTLAAFIGLFALTFAFSPAVRAAVQSMFTFNGVEVSVDEATGELVASGNTGAIVYQDANNIMVQGEDENEMQGISVFASNESAVDVAEIPTIAPDFVMPTNLPAGYELEPQAILFDDTVAVTWTNADGDFLSYHWGEMPTPDDISFLGDAEVINLTGGEIDLEGVPAEMIEHMEAMMQPYQILPGFDGNDIAILSGESDGVPFQITASDTTLTEVDLQAIAP
ncbi:MAG: hypothetical protein ACPG8W_16840 [Candidatus Promineifilaceae bacterium]